MQHCGQLDADKEFGASSMLAPVEGAGKLEATKYRLTDIRFCAILINQDFGLFSHLLIILN